MPTVDRSPRRTVSLVVLAIGTFAIGTDGHIVIGLLDRIAADFQVSDSQSGQLVSVFAFCYALFAPVCGWLFGGYDRKKSIQIASVAFVLGNALCYIAQSYDVLVLGRVVAAFGAGMFTPLAFTLATGLVDDARRGMALSIVFGGMTVAMVMGVPLGSYLGRVADWHLVFLIIAIIGIVNLLLLSVLLPALPPGTPPEQVGAHLIASAKRDDAARGVVWPEIDPAQMTAAGFDWHVFPNTVIIQQPTSALCYRARPNGYNPDSCIFEVYVLERFPEGQEPKTQWVFQPEPSEEKWLKILSQDFQNMPEVQRGMKSRGFMGARPSPVQEKAVTNFHRSLAEFMGTGAPVEIK